MNLVFRADGLNTGEFAFLMACCNHTDDRGYVIASMQQLADEAHLKMTAAKANKQRLIKRRLLASKERYSPKNGARISDLYRVNLKLLASMKRERVDYGPSLVEELSFASAEETPSSDPRSDSAGGAGSDSDPLLLPSSSPSSLSGAAGEQQEQESRGSVAGEREAAEPKDDNPTDSPAGVGATEDVDKVMDAYIAAYMTALQMPPSPAETRTVRAGAVTLLAAGRSVGSLCVLAAQLPGKGWTDLVQHARKNPEKTARPTAQSRPWCGECNYGQEPMFPSARMREGAGGRMEKCHCHPGYVPPQTARV
ncbi:hypothetical protein PV378_13650 [Streptomyces scabiei]|nr:hypothetical protein [Streptomyces scabiei]